MTAPYILAMQPDIKPKVWGGRKLARRFGKRLPDQGPYGEAWEVADLPEGQSTIINGPLAGQPLRDAVAQWGAALIGREAPQDNFPLLVKLLDAQRDLSVQVHPGEHDLAGLTDGAESKDESWLILDVTPGGSILHGFEAAISPDAFLQAVEEGRADQMLRRVPVAAGDVIRVAPNTIHAICEGVALLEIQQPSDTTYRVFDYNRPGLDGQPRPLHLDRAMQVSNFDAHAPARLTPREDPIPTGTLDVLVDVDAYRVERLRATQKARWQINPASPQVIFVSRGSATLVGPSNTVELGPYETAVVPAASEWVELTPDTSSAPSEVIVAGLSAGPLVSP